MNVIVTGNRLGIGRAITEELLNDGHQVFGCSRKATDFEKESYHHYQINVGIEKDVCNMVADIRTNFKHVDALINNAGIASMNHLFLTPSKTVEDIFTTNFLGTFLFCREVGKIMSRQKNGRIINMSSIASPLNLKGESVYAASKAAVENFSKTIAKELQEFNITVNTIGPGPVNTSLTKHLGGDKIENVINQQIIKKENGFNDIYNVVDFLLKPESALISGQHFYIGGA